MSRPRSSSLGVPVSRRVAEVVVFEYLDGDVAEGLVGKIARDVGEGRGREASLAIQELDGDRLLAQNLVDNFSRAQGDVDVVVAVPMHERIGVGRDFDVEDADELVLENEMMVGLGGDFDFGCGGLRGEESGGEKEEDEALHGANCSIGGGAY